MSVQRPMSVHVVAVVMVGALAAGGPLAPLAAAQPPAQTQQPAPPPTPPEPVADAATEAREVRRGLRGGPDMYDVIALPMTIVGAPLKLVVCATGIIVGTTLFLVTFGSADRASAAVMREGCAQNWWVSGKDIRPEESP
jgi:hypothetical protein